MISVFCLLIIFIPIFLVRKEPENIVIEEAKEEPKYDYKQYNNMRVLHAKTNSVEKINLDDYLLGVVSAEMPANYEQEALNAQAVVARTYTIYSIEHNKNKHENADICDDSNCCQAWISKDNRLERWDEDKRDEYWKKIENAVKNTKGKIITYNGEVIDAFFTQIAEDIRRFQQMFGEEPAIHIYKRFKHQEKKHIHNINQKLK